MADGQIVIATDIDTKGIDVGRKKIESDLKQTGDKAEQDSNKASNALADIAKKGASIALKGVTVAAGAITSLTGLAVKQYATYEQMTGGVETLFKDSAQLVERYASSAFETAGLSANEYMETITGFSASLLQGLGGDTEKAARIGNMAVTDMSDNANKMGTAMEDIQNAYQGFAKQNYTMLDNLKLGYGGTKEEMQRLLSDAEKLTGRKFDLSNFSDIIEAIHAIQENMDITGTTSREAATTIEGSLNMTKAAWKNMLTSMADENGDVFEESINDLVYSVGAFSENILPRIEIALNGVGSLIDALLPPIAEKLPEIITSILPRILEIGVNVVLSLINGILSALPTLIDAVLQSVESIASSLGENLPSLCESVINVLMDLIEILINAQPQLIEAAGNLLRGLIEGLINGIETLMERLPELLQERAAELENEIPTFLQVGSDLILTLIQGISEMLPMLADILPQIIDTIVGFFTDNLPQILEQGIQIIMTLIDGINQCLPQLLEQLPTIISSIVTALAQALPQLLNAGIQIIVMLIGGIVQALPQLICYIPQIVQTILSILITNLPLIISAGIQILTALITGLIQCLPQLISYLPQIIQTIVQVLIENLPLLIEAGIEILVAVINGLIQAIPQLIAAVPQIISALWNAFTSVDWLELGWNIIKGIGSGIVQGVKGLIDSAIQACGELVDSIKDFFGIHSPSRLMRDEVGKFLMKGIGVGVELETPNLQRQLDDNLESLYADLKGTVDAGIAETTAQVVTTTNYNIRNINKTTNENNATNGGSGSGIMIHNVTQIDGKTVAEATAPYMDTELGNIQGVRERGGC